MSFVDKLKGAAHRVPHPHMPNVPPLPGLPPMPHPPGLLHLPPGVPHLPHVPGKGMTPDEVAYHKFPAVGTLKAGDMLIVKVWGVEKHMIGNVIRGGQAVFSHANGSSNDQHALIMVSATKTAEAGGKGVHTSTVDTRAHLVFRITDTQLAHEAAYVGSRLIGQGGTVTPGKYNIPGAGTTFFRHKNVGPRAHAYLQRVYDVVYSNKHAKGPDMFCSQLVATCVEVAAMRLHRHGLGVDPQAMSPKALEAAFKVHPGLFHFLGRYPA